MKTKEKGLEHFEQEFIATPEGAATLSAMQSALDKATISSKRIMLPEGESIKFGVIGDTHLGSRFEDLNGLTAYYKHCKEAGVKDVLHAGDVLDGHRIYKGQEFEVHKLGWHEQSKWFAARVPKIDGVTTHFITGNHDDSLKKLAGIIVGEELAQLRPDWEFMGSDMGRVTFTSGKRKYQVMLLHPGGGSAYALSYKPQKIIEQLEGGTKPDMICIGHFHKAEMIPHYRNICAVQVGTFQRQTPFMVQKGLSAMMGGWIFEVSLGQRCNVVKSEFISIF